MNKRFARLTQEATFGTYASGGATNIIRGNGANWFKPFTKPQLWQIMDASGLNVPALVGSNVSMVGGQLVTQLYASQAQFLLGWALTRINSAQTAPWTTAELPWDLASCTLDYAYAFTGGTLQRKRILGCKVASGSIVCSTDSPVAILTLNILGSTPQGNTFDSSTDPDATALPEPAASAYPTDPYVFQHTKGFLNINATTRTQYDRINLSWQNSMKAYFDESRFANAIKMNGRRCSLNAHLRLKSSPNDRASVFETTSAVAASCKFDNGTNTCKIDFLGKNFADTHDEDMPADEEFYYDLKLMSAIDTSGTSPNLDAVLTFT